MANTYEKTRLSLSTRPKTSSCRRKDTMPCFPGCMRTQSTRATAGSRTITRRLVRGRNKGRSQAPTIKMSPGCTHSGVIVVFRTREPQLPEELRRDDDRDAGDEP